MYRTLLGGIAPAVLVALAPGHALADKVGDPAAPLTIVEWIKGQPSEIKPSSNIYVVEFWAALSPNCRAVIPVLNDLQKKYQDKGVVILGISDEPPDKVRSFVEVSGTQIDYTVAADDNRKTARRYMVAYGQNGIPHAFVVGKDGKVLWHGHPAVGLDKALEQITTGTYDLEKAAKLDARRAEVEDYLTQARRGEPGAKEVGRKYLAAHTNDVARLCDFAYRIVTDTRNKNRDFALANEALAQVEKVAGPKFPQLVMVRGHVLFETGKQEEGIAMVKEAVELVKDPEAQRNAITYLRVLEGRAEADRRAKERAKNPTE